MSAEDYRRECRQANQLVGTATANLTRAIAFALHAAADTDDDEASSRHVKDAMELRKIAGRLPHITFRPTLPPAPAGSDQGQVPPRTVRVLREEDAA